MSDQVESVKGTVVEAFKLTMEQANKVIASSKPFMDAYREGRITNCAMVKDSVEAAESVEEKQYAAYICGIYHEHQQHTNPFNFLLNN